MRFYLVLSIFLAYTLFRVGELLPGYPILGGLLGFLLFAVMLSAIILPRLQKQAFDTLWFQVLVWLGSMCIGLWGSFLMLSLPFEVLRLVLWPVLGQNAYNSFFEISTLSLFVISILMALAGFLEVLRGPVVKEVLVRIPDLSPDLRGFSIVQISDLHIGSTIRSRFVRKVVSRANALDTDVVVLTGDIVDAPASAVIPHLKELEKLKSRDGVFYVTGNHEYYWSADPICAELRKIGFHVLLNQNHILEKNGSRVMIAGVTDPTGEVLGGSHRPDVPRAAKNAGPEPSFKILLAHRPGVFEEAALAGFDLQLSGHTHAGQFFPFSLLIPLAHRYHRGLYRHAEKLWVYVNPGTGYWGPANRFGIPSEITHLKLENWPPCV